MSTTITILTTNDIHGRFLSGDGSGILNYAKLATYKKSLKNCLLVDAGDATQGTPLAILERGIYPIQIMNAVGYDAVTIGNHEFDNISKDTPDTHELDDIVSESKAPYICANVIWKSNNKNYIQHVYEKKKITDRGNGRYLLKEVGGKQLLFVGLCTPTISMGIPRMSDFEINKEGVVKEIKKAISDAKSEYQCSAFDAVILLAHIGKSTSGYNTYDIINDLSSEDNVSLIIDGHSHEKYSEDYKGVKIFQADCYSKCFGQITLEFDGSNKPEIKTEHCTNEKIEKCETDAGVRNALTEIEKVIKNKFGTVYSSGSNTTLWGGAIDEDKPYVRKGLAALNITRFVQTNLGKLTAEAMIHTVRTNHSDKINEADYIVAGINGGAVRDSIPFGKPITGNELFYALPSLLDSDAESGYVVFNISIKKLKDVLDNSIKGLVYDGKQITSGSGGFLNMGGIRYTVQYDNQTRKIVIGDKAVLTCGKNPRIGSKEISFSADGQKTVLLCVSKYVASGGDGYDFRGAQELCRAKDPSIYMSAGEYISYLSGSAKGSEKPLFYSAAASDIQYNGFNFTVPDTLSVTVQNEKGENLLNQYIVYSFCDERGYKNYNAAITDSYGNVKINPPAGANTLCVGATIGNADKNKTYLYGELYLHSYFSLKKAAIKCLVSPFDTSGYLTFDKNAWSQFEHKAMDSGKIHYSNYVKYLNENGERCTFTMVEGKILSWLDKDKNIKQVNTVVYLDNNRNRKQFNAFLPQEGISYVTWNNSGFTSRLAVDNMPDVSCLYGGDHTPTVQYHDGCLFALNHRMNVVGLRVRSGEILDAIGFIYENNEEFFFGNAAGGGETIIHLEKDEYITAIKGCVSSHYYDCVTQLTVITNKRNLGPYGSIAGRNGFVIQKPGHIITALLGEVSLGEGKDRQPEPWNKEVVKKLGVLFAKFPKQYSQSTKGEADA